MKKVVVSFIVCLMVIGCQNKELYELSGEYYNKETSFTEITKQELETLEKDRKSFSIFVYSPNCTTSASFHKVLINFLEQEQLNFYKISAIQAKDTMINKTLKYYPSVVIYQEGEIVSYLKPDQDDDMPYYQSVAGFKEWFSQNLNLS